MRLARIWVSFVVVMCFIVAASPVTAQDAKQGEGALPADLQTGEVVTYMPDGAPVIITPGPTVESVLHADGSVVEVKTHTVTRFMCGGDTVHSTVDDLRRFMERAPGLYDEDVEYHVISGQGVRGGLNVVWNVTGGFSAEGEAALETAAAYIESQFSDPVTITIWVSMEVMGGGELGGTVNEYSDNAWTTARNGLESGMDDDDVIQAYLPPPPSIPIRYDTSLPDNITNEGHVFVTKANYSATIGSASGRSATMTFNSNYSWDFDPTNGVPGNKFCFQSVVAHEGGHVLGFVSGSTFRDEEIELMDAYRFEWTGIRDPGDYAEFESMARTVESNNLDNSSSDLISVEYRMADGVPNQSSHFREQSPPIGTMDPLTGMGESAYPDFYLEPDLVMFDAVGWDRTPTITLPFFDSFPSTSIDTAKWAADPGAEINTLGIDEHSAPYSLNLDGNSSTGGDEALTGLIDTSGTVGIAIEYWYQRTGGGDSTETDDNLVVEYLDSSLTWVEVEASPHLGSGPDMVVFEQVVLVLPENAKHELFRLKFRATSTITGLDDWFVDDVHVYEVADVTPPDPDPMTFSLAPVANSTSSVIMMATEAFDDDSPPVRYFFDCVSGGPGCDDSDQSTSMYVDGDLSPNEEYTYRVQARDSAEVPNFTGFSDSVTTATWANVPGAPVLGDAECNSMTVDVTPGDNPTHTEFAIECSNTSPADATWDGKYVDASGSPSGSPVWGADADWGVKAVVGLTQLTTYTFRVTARNLDDVLTDPGPETSLATTECGGGGDGDFDVDGDVDLDDFASFQVCFTQAGVGDCQPGDMNGSGVVDLDDFTLFFAALNGP